MNKNIFKHKNNKICINNLDYNLHFTFILTKYNKEEINKINNIDYTKENINIIILDKEEKIEKIEKDNIFYIETDYEKEIDKIILGIKLASRESFIILKFNINNNNIINEINDLIKKEKRMISIISKNKQDFICINRELILSYEEKYTTIKDITNEIIKIEENDIYEYIEDKLIKNDIENNIKKSNNMKITLLDYYLKERDKNIFIKKLELDEIKNPELKYEKLKNNILNIDDDYYILEYIKNINEINYEDLIENNINYYNIEKIEGDINFIIPVKEREENFYYILKNIKETIKEHDIIFTIFEYGEKYKEICENKEVNYISFNDKQFSNFNKSISINLTYKLYEKQNVKYNSIIFHDVDCVIQESFFDNLNEIKNKYKFIQTYGNRYVLMANKILSNKIRNEEININDITENTEGIKIPGKGSTGGSLYITKELFKKIGGFDPELFYSYSCEDMFFWEKVKLYEEIGYCDDPLNTIIHLYHESPRHSNNEIYKINPYYSTNIYTMEIFNSLPNNKKEEFIKKCNEKLIT